jgi:hypothetical protein
MGAKAGIGIGVALLLLLLSVIAFIFFRTRRKKLPVEISAGQEQNVSELHEQDSTIHKAGSKTVYPHNELAAVREKCTS